jgi:hypothetical protein
MASLSAEALFLAGFALAHAAWSVSDTSPDELLCPLVFLERGDERRLVRFEAETQAKAISAMKDAMGAAMREEEAFAAASEGTWRPNGIGSDSEDVITVDFWAPGMDAAATTLQPFRRAQIESRFTLLTQPRLVLNGVMVNQDDAAPALELLLEGVRSHSAVHSLWDSWLRV